MKEFFRNCGRVLSFSVTAFITIALVLVGLLLLGGTMLKLPGLAVWLWSKPESPIIFAVPIAVFFAVAIFSAITDQFFREGFIRFVIRSLQIGILLSWVWFYVQEEETILEGLTIGLVAGVFMALIYSFVLKRLLAAAIALFFRLKPRPAGIDKRQEH